MLISQVPEALRKDRKTENLSAMYSTTLIYIGKLITSSCKSIKHECSSASRPPVLMIPPSKSVIVYLPLFSVVLCPATSKPIRNSRSRPLHVTLMKGNKRSLSEDSSLKFPFKAIARYLIFFSPLYAIVKPIMRT